MNCCATCKHWGEGDRPIVGFEVGQKKHCGLYVYGPNRDDAESYLEDGDFASSNGSLWTEPTFGCTRWEAP